LAATEQKDTVTCTIDGRQVTVPKGTNIIEAAEQVGVGVPHYCYHSALSVPAMCRMCLVEIEGAPKLSPACQTPVSDGQVIHTESERAHQARTGVLEFYLVNHPLDCPICDKSGECKLQDYVHDEGRRHGRSIEPKRVLGQDDFGGDVVYDGDRCIVCTRCVRFMREIAGADLLCVVERGSRSVIDTFFDDGVGSSIWADNIIDICPVGALLSKDFHHKARVWDLDRTPSICPNCSQGCNITLDVRDNLVMRLRPRHNADVNSYWMCDPGRLDYEWINGGGRVEVPLVRDGTGKLRPTAWREAVLALVDALKAVRAGGATKVLSVASPMHANEDAGLLARLADVLGGGPKVFRSRRTADEIACPGFQQLARRRDLAANVRGLEILGYGRVGEDDATGGLPEAAGVVLSLGDALEDAPADFGGDADLFICLAERMTPAARNAHFVLPITSFAEQEGTFTNHAGRVQRFWPGRQAPPLARPAWQVLGVVLAGLDDAAAPATAGDAFLRLVELHDAFSGLDYGVLGSAGAPLAAGARRPAAIQEGNS
jgi:NADH-quinone oxidoreductase subunit G